MSQPLTYSKRKQLYDRQHGKCFYCKTSISRLQDMGMEHVLPRSKGGRDARFNLVGSCKPCDTLKADIASRTEAEAHIAKLRAFWEQNGDVIETIIADKQYLLRHPGPV